MEGEVEPAVRPRKGATGAGANMGNAAKPKVAGGAPSLGGLIAIEAGFGSTVRPGAKVDPFTFYLDFYRSDDKDRTDPERLRTTVRDLNRIGKFPEVRAALTGYLKNHSKLAEPWMYEALAGAIELNKGSAADVKKALNYAADLAQRSHNPNHLVSVADQLVRREYLDRVGALLDEAMPLVPHRFEPMVMSINLAQKTRDPKRMGDAVERLLALGWAGQDDYFRLESSNQVDTLARALREDGKGTAADALLARLTASQARDLFIRLSWDGDADYDLAVDESLGATATVLTPRTVFGGAIIKNGYGNHPEEVYVCPRGFDGDFTVRISTVYANPEKPVTRLTLETITHEGTSDEKKQSIELSPDKPNKPVVVHLTGGRRKKVLPYVDPAAELMRAAAENAKKARPGNDLRKVAAPPAAPPAVPGGAATSKAGSVKP
jgi:hypothetical protein